MSAASRAKRSRIAAQAMARPARWVRQPGSTASADPLRMVMVALMPPPCGRKGRPSPPAARAAPASDSPPPSAGARRRRKRRRGWGRRADRRSRIACDSALSATIRSRPGSAAIPSKAAAEATTGFAIAIASSTLFWMPRAMRRGATTTSAAASQARTSSTSPVTITLSPASFRTASAGLRPTIAKVAPGSFGSTSAANQITASTLGA